MELPSEQPQWRPTQHPYPVFIPCSRDFPCPPRRRGQTHLQQTCGPQVSGSRESSSFLCSSSFLSARQWRVDAGFVVLRLPLCSHWQFLDLCMWMSNKRIQRAMPFHKRCLGLSFTLARMLRFWRPRARGHIPSCCSDERTGLSSRASASGLFHTCSRLCVNQ